MPRLTFLINYWIKESRDNGIIRLSLRANPATSPEETTRYQLFQCSRHCVLRLFRDASRLIHTFHFSHFFHPLLRNTQEGFHLDLSFNCHISFFIICPVLIESAKFTECGPSFLNMMLWTVVLLALEWCFPIMEKPFLAKPSTIRCNLTEMVCPCMISNKLRSPSTFKLPPMPPPLITSDT